MPPRGVPLGTSQGCTHTVFQGWFCSPGMDVRQQDQKYKELTNYRVKVISTTCLAASLSKLHLINKCTSFGP
jgi:hypothetical protein